jgi:hypothetical protein
VTDRPESTQRGTEHLTLGPSSAPAPAPEPCTPHSTSAQRTFDPSYLVAVGLGLFFIAVVNLAVRHAELVTGRYVTGGVPPVAAFGALLTLLGLRALLRRFTRTDLTREQLLIVYSMVALGTFMAGAYAVRAFLPHVVTLQYWSRSRTELALFVPYVPSWFAPTDAEAVRRYFEGSLEGKVPWALWLPPLAIWLMFWIALFGAAWCLMLLFRRQWVHHERLSFPLLTLPLALTSEGDTSRFGARPLVRSPVLWLGLAVAALFDGLNIGHALRPTLPAPGFYISLSGLFPDRPLTPLNSVTLFFMLEAIGFGYFVPLDISFSMWFFYLLEKLFAVGALAYGYDTPGLPFLQEQSAGAYLAIGALILEGSRQRLRLQWRRAFLQPWRSTTAEDRETRAAWLVLAACGSFLVWFCTRAGLSLPITLPYFVVLGCFLLVYARLRAETGVPFEFIYPYGLPKELIVQSFSVTGLLRLGGPRAMTMLSAFAWLSRHHAASATAAHQIDALKLGDVARIRRRRLLMALACAFIFGFGCACWSHLSAYYALGSNVAGGGAGEGEYRARVALQEFQRMAGQVKLPPDPDYTRLGYVGAGAAIAFALSGLRHVWLGSPFHPLGFILATAYGDSPTMLFPLFVAWLLKWLLLRAGGLRLYRAGLPFFIGLIVGHFTLAGIVWPLLSLLISPEASAAYHLYFG